VEGSQGMQRELGIIYDRGPRIIILACLKSQKIGKAQSFHERARDF